MNAHENKAGIGSHWNSHRATFSIFHLVMLTAIALFVGAGFAWGDSDEKGHQEKKGHGMEMMGCDREVHLTMDAEMQMGGAQFKGAMTKTAGKKGMKGMNMDKGAKKPMTMAGAHSDHDAKTGGVLFMAPNEIHHVEGSFSPECGFQMFLYNAFTKPIHVGRFHAFIRVTGERGDEEVELVRFLLPNQEGSILQAKLPHDMKPPFDIELNVRFPEGDGVEVFNFAVDEHGEMS